MSLIISALGFLLSGQVLPRCVQSNAWIWRTSAIRVVDITAWTRATASRILDETKLTKGLFQAINKQVMMMMMNTFWCECFAMAR